MEFFDYAGNTLNYKNPCPSCGFINREFSLPCQLVYEDDICIINQDWETPINGFIIIATKRHVCLFEELADEERNHIFGIANKITKILRKHGIVKNFNIHFDEKADGHFHVWILPRDNWKERGIDPTKDYRLVSKYAIENLRTEENLKVIENTVNLLHEELKNN